MSYGAYDLPDDISQWNCMAAEPTEEAFLIHVLEYVAHRLGQLSAERITNE
jgi:hypothetical protein